MNKELKVQHKAAQTLHENEIIKQLYLSRHFQAVTHTLSGPDPTLLDHKLCIGRGGACCLHCCVHPDAQLYLPSEMISFKISLLGLPWWSSG